MSASSTISNLEQALNCAGKCDCCSKLQQQINSLNQRVSNLEASSKSGSDEYARQLAA